MQNVIHRAEDRGRGEYGWLSTRYSFSFANWYEPTRMGFGRLRVINDDTIAPASGFPMHAHRDMEIITIVTKGILTHKDSLGNTGTVKTGEVQVMSAGTGVVHSEYNASATEPLELFQIWIQPKEQGEAPRYEQKTFTKGKVDLAVGDKSHITRIAIEAGKTFNYTLHTKGNGVYVFVIDGRITLAGETLEKRDAIGLTDSEHIEIAAATPADVLCIEVPMR